VTNLTAWLEVLVAARGSDLHVKVGSTPRMRWTAAWRTWKAR
jgi:Tfp pilus assembly pilus retraction ATPase PilT